ncbi:tipE homolog 4 [Carabus blaptoides fortunei]
MKSCTRYCPKIGTTGANIYIGYEDSVIIMQCKSIIATNECRGIEEGQVINPETIWTAKPGEILLTSCGSITRNGTSLSATDCINGTLIGDEDIVKPYINFTVYWNLLRNSTKVLDPSQRFMPPQWALTMYNNSDLFINLDGCVNTLQGECKDFLQTHGRDGANETAQSRFSCFYNKNDSSRVVARFDLEKVWKELIIAITIPSILFVISFITLCIITHSVKVGDDTKMRCKCCIGTHETSTQVPLVKPELHKPKPRNKRNTQTDDEQVEEETSINDDFQ